MPYSTIQLEWGEAAVTLTLNRPERRNALSPEMIQELVQALGEVESSPARVLILTGAGGSFCSGMDLSALEAMTSQSFEQTLQDTRRIMGMFRRLWEFPKPVIAAVNGAAVAGGCGLATMGDFTLAAPEATFGYPEVRIGFMPAIVAAFVVRQIGEKRARDLLLSGRLFGAEEAYRMGLVTEIVPRPELPHRSAALASRLAECSPGSLEETKRLLRKMAEPELDRELELAVEASAHIRSTEDFREGVLAFLEKRKPLWSGR